MERWNTTTPPIPTHEGGIGPTEIDLPENEEAMVYIDTMSMQLDHLLGLYQASLAYFEEDDTRQAYTYIARAPGDDAAERGDRYTHVVRRENMTVYGKMIADRFNDLARHSPLAHEVGRDTLKMWSVPAEVRLEPAVESEVRP